MNNVLEDGDYDAPHGCWLTIRNASIRIIPTDEGISVTIYRLGNEMADSVAETWATYAELEDGE